MVEPVGLLAAFVDAQSLVRATRAAWHQGYRHIDAFAPYPLPTLEGLLAPTASRVSLCACLGAMIGAVLGLALQVWAALAYPLNIGGRPLLAWPAFVVVTFLFAVVFAAVAALLAMLCAARLPRLHHPLFGAEGFERGNDDRFLLVIHTSDPLFDTVRTRAWLQAGAQVVVEVGP